MKEGVNQLKYEFLQHKKKAQQFNPAALPIINELEDVALKRANGKMSSSNAKNKIKSCCMKVGINPIAVDQTLFEPKLNFKQQMNQKHLKVQKHNYNTSLPMVKQQRAGRRALNPIFPAAPSLKKKQHQTFNLLQKKPKGNLKRFEIQPIKLGLNKKPSSSKSFGLKPIKLGFDKKKKGKWF